MAGSGTPLSQFNSFAEATGSLYITGPRYIVNEAQEHTYSFGYITKGDTGKKKMVQGGANIRESIIFESNGTAQFVKPGKVRNWVNPQKLKKLQAEWRFAEAHMAWTRQEIMLNERIRYGDEGAMFHQFVDLLFEKEMIMWTDKWKLLELQLWAQPDKDAMEATDGEEPYSIPAFVNEDTNGLFNPQDGNVWTVVETIDPTASGFTKFKPAQRTYSSAAINNAGNIISTFDMTWRDVRFEMPPSFQEYFSKPAYNKQAIWASAVGRSAYEQLIREHSTEGFHNIAGSQDPSIPDPQYRGIPIRWVSALDTATLYNSGSSTVVSEGSADKIGPRYYWINAEFLYPVFHDEMYFEKDEITRHHNDTDTYVMPVNTWYNVICTSRQRQAIVSPSTDLYAALYS